MTDIYGEALAAAKHRLLASTPLVLALFTGAGGRMMLYRPGHPTVEAPTVPITYQSLKAVSHSCLAVFELATLCCGAPSVNATTALPGLGAANQRALDLLPESGLDDDEIQPTRHLLGLNSQLLNRLSSSCPVTADVLSDFARACAPHLVKLIDRAAALQVSHWMGVLDHWQAMLGATWERTFAAVNTMYVTRQKNILFTILAQFMGETSIGERLLLFETPQFTTTPDNLLDLLAKTLADRELGRAFFGHGRVMDVEILGDAATAAIRAEAGRRRMAPVLPTCAPYDSKQWPWCTDPASGTAPSTLRTLVGLDP
ncbi:hypothetical protein [Nonomuraea longicatena]